MAPDADELASSPDTHSEGIVPPKKRHHYLPQSYLRGFADPTRDGFIWVYERNGGKPVRTNIVNAGVQGHYHSFTGADGSVDSDSIEDTLQKIEDIFTWTIQKVAGVQPLTQGDKATLPLLLAIMLIRVPKFRADTERTYLASQQWTWSTVASHGERFGRTLEWLETEAGLKPPVSVDEFRESILSGDLAFKPDPTVYLGLFELTPRLVPIFEAMR